MTPREKRARAAELVAKAQAIYDRHKTPEDPEFTDDEIHERDAALAEADKLVNQAETQEASEKRLNDLDVRIRAGGTTTANPLPHQDAANVRGHSYSFLKAIRQMSSNGAERFDGLEAEVSLEIAKRTNRTPRGFFMPTDLAVRGGFEIERRDLTTTTGSGAKPTITQMGTWIELLRNATLSRQLGVQILSDMTGDFAIPKKTAASTAYWVTEGNAGTEANQTVGQVLFQPSSLTAFSDISRKFMIQSSFDAEMFVRQDLAETIAIELDRVTFNGSGSGAEPQGIIPDSTVNITAVGTNGGPMTYALFLAMESDLAVQNAPTSYTAFVTTPKVRANLKALVKFTSTASPIWDKTEADGYPAFATNQMPSTLTKGTAVGTCHSAILGVWNQAIWAFWTGLDVLVDPYTASTSGTVRIVMFQDADFQLRQSKAFSVVKDIVPT